MRLKVSLCLSDMVTFRVVWKKNSYTVTFPVDEKALKLKQHIQTLTGNSTLKVYVLLSIDQCKLCLRSGGYLLTGEELVILV